MDRISQLPDELLLQILSFLPSTKQVVATKVLSKRWQFLWKMVPKLAPVIQALHFKLSQACSSGDIRVWIRDADKRCVLELIIDIDICSFPGGRRSTRVSLPRSCRMLVTLKLSNAVLVDDVSSSISFPSLKKLSLISIKFASCNFVDKLLSSCPVLEDLVIHDQFQDDFIAVWRVKVPSLKSLFVHKSEYIKYLRWFCIDTPSLECLHILEKAILDVSHHNSLDPIKSVKHLELCSSKISKDACPVVFLRLEKLRVCTCGTQWMYLLMHVLGASPNLRALKLERRGSQHATAPELSEPSSVPRCLLTSLETFEWVQYEGAKEEKEVAAFILRNANCLKKATIISPQHTHRDKKFEMVKELASWPRGSRTCQLVFD
ncbi:hypothetical protein EUTSA_v10015273mg [Eutrema salsugineum]|uniref:F-box domain-containing protein n=1 Tax=Eutrema salsugineum TaxID=72664 RepID=V4KXR6_EUTSA|nr:hypothetical protein EUTSA_v10015273mg [Eutrema salsugineum]